MSGAAQRDVWAATLVELARSNPDLLVLDGDLATSTRADRFAAAHPDRFLQMGIAEQGMVGTAVGLASMDDHLEGQVEKFPLIVLASVDDERHGFLFGSLERVGGTPCVLWGLGAVRKGRASGTTKIGRAHV